jgi:adenylate cyclase
MIVVMQLPSALSFLVDEAMDVPDSDAFLTALGARLVADGLPLAGGALTQAAPHPIIARRPWLWRADTGRVSMTRSAATGWLASEPVSCSKISPAAP